MCPQSSSSVQIMPVCSTEWSSAKFVNGQWGQDKSGKDEFELVYD